MFLDSNTSKFYPPLFPCFTVVHGFTATLSDGKEGLVRMPKMITIWRFFNPSDSCHALSLGHKILWKTKCNISIN